MQFLQAVMIFAVSLSPVAAFDICASTPTVTLTKVTSETIMVDGETITFTHSGFQVR
jgi:hypothetical protein